MRRISQRKSQGFTLIELMIVIAIIGILAAIAIPNFIEYRKRAYNSAANADVKNAYTAAQSYFNEFPDGAVSLADLASYGYIQSPQVNTTVVTGGQSALELTTTHTQGTRTYTTDVAGRITSTGT